MLTEEITCFLLSSPDVAELITDLVPDALPQGAKLPACDIELLNNTPHLYLGGRTGVHESRVVIDCYAKTRKKAHEVAEAIMNSGIVTLRGELGSANVLSVKPFGPTDTVEEVDPASDRRRYVSSVTLEVMWADESSQD